MWIVFYLQSNTDSCREKQTAFLRFENEVMSFKWTLQGCDSLSAIAMEAGTYLATLYAAF